MTDAKKLDTIRSVLRAAGTPADAIEVRAKRMLHNLTATSSPTDAEKERAAIVAFQRERARKLDSAANRLEGHPPCAFKMVLAQAEITDMIADAIERGDHLENTNER